MSWQTPKTNWDTHPKAIEASDLNRMERNIEVVREQGDMPLNLEVVTSFPAHVPGRAIYHVGDGRAYVSDGSRWLMYAAPNRGKVILTPGTAQVPIPEGYHDGTGYVATDGELKAENIKKGKTIFGVSGNAPVISPNFEKMGPWETDFSLTLNDDYIWEFACSREAVYLRAVTVEAVDFTYFNTIAIAFKRTGSSGTYGDYRHFYFNYNKSTSWTHSGAIDLHELAPVTNRGEFAKIDITSLTGKHYLMFYHPGGSRDYGKNTLYFSYPMLF